MRAASAALAFAIGCCVIAAPTFAQDRPARAGLNARVGQINFQQVALADALDYLRDTSGLNLYVNWVALELAGVDRNLPVTIELRDVSARQLLNLLLNSAAPGVLTWYVDENVVHVTTRELADQVMITRVYPVMDLLTEVRDFEPPDVTLDSGGDGGGQGLFGGGGGRDSGETSSLDERADDLIRLVQTMVEPDVWQENGGFATIRFFLGNLVVTAPRRVHERIGGPIR